MFRKTDEIVDDVIEFRGVTKVFGDALDAALERLDAGASKGAVLADTGCTVALRDVSLTVRRNETFVVMGRSGSGKSTLLRCVNGLATPTRGAVCVDGDDVTTMDVASVRRLCRERLAMVFQQFGLFPHRTVAGNVAYGLEVNGVAASERDARVADALEQVGLADYAGHRPSALSGGMQQRVGLARALATDPDVLLMDEPFSALDPLIRSGLQDELMRLQSERPRTVVFITHDLDEALRLGDRVAILEGGVVRQVGTPADVVLRPENDHVRAFVRDVDRTQVLRARALARSDDIPDAETSDAPTVDADAPLADVVPLMLRANGRVTVVDGDSVLGTIQRTDLADVLDAR